ncbi:MAG: DMT family transporter [Burkholderiaceae bacterium]|nr:DMT family transporter [Burkholderiaceae bacterium]
MHLPATALACLLFNAFVWGVSWWPFRQLNALGLHSLWATGFAFLFATVVISLWRPAAWPGLLRQPQLWWLVLAAGVTNATFNWGVMIGEVVRVVLLFYLMPVWSLLLARWLLDESVTRASLGRVALALAGALIVLWQPGAALPWPSSLADWLGLVGGASFALVNVLVRRYRAAADETRALAMFVGGFAVAFAMAALLASSGIIGYPPAAGTAWIAGNVALAVALLAGNLALQYGVARVPAAVTAIVMLAEVPFAALSSTWLGGETMSGRTIAGGVLILSATVLASLQASRSPGREAVSGGSTT